MPHQASREVGAEHDPRVTQSTARALLMAAASGEPVPAVMVDGLIAAVLSRDPLVAMALEAREEGPHRLMRALRLAAAVCEASRAAETLTGTDGGSR